MSPVSNGLYFLTLPLVSVMRVLGARYTLGARYLSKNTVYRYIYITNKFDFLLYGLTIRDVDVGCGVMKVRPSGAPSASLAACSKFSICNAANSLVTAGWL